VNGLPAEKAKIIQNTCSNCTLSTINYTWVVLGLNPDRLTAWSLARRSGRGTRTSTGGLSYNQFVSLSLCLCLNGEDHIVVSVETAFLLIQTYFPLEQKWIMTV
jgi:hypothetical protein